MAVAKIMTFNAELVPSVPDPVTPSDPITPVVTETPETPVAEPTPVAPAESLYDLPDGRKVDAATLQREWKENFLPDYTRKSQKLAEVERSFTKPEENIPEWKKPDYVPKTYAEVIELARQEALNSIQGERAAEEQRVKQVAEQVDAQIAAIRAKDPKLDENALFVHASKWGFRDLNQAYDNMKYTRQVELDTEQRVLKNLKTRQDPVGGAPGNKAPDTGVDPNVGRRYGSALEYLRGIKS